MLLLVIKLVNFSHWVNSRNCCFTYEHQEDPIADNDHIVKTLSLFVAQRFTQQKDD